ncbi:carboxylesterase [Rhizodiscina lignyota]|uniref:Carboxylic ester hydrolase n=1 Tax=Rhizodiscina lignyota TaxID=1504668 RepID=A0A9P4M578_9PEZI|nr:carboxylesterase [Rhizodiscina lignyota]
MILPAFQSLLLSFFCAVPALAETIQARSTGVPTARTRNGTYGGRYIPEWDQDVFLGMPYAQPPLGDLRFRWPRPLNASFSGVRDASQYGYSCMQYAGEPWGNFNMSEDCLNINVVRPHGAPKQPLPILVWIYGGGLYTGSTADPRYNLSGVVKVSQDMGQPIIAVDMNYRLNMYGFLQTQELFLEGSSNAGLLDQRMALQWVQDNIAAFGGDPRRVVIWGESAGAQSIAFQLLSFNGTNDGLYRGAIMESGGPTGTQLHELGYYSTPFENLTRAVGCWTAEDQLACLRDLSQEALYAGRPSLTWNPLVDGNFLRGFPSQLLVDNNFKKVPLLIGANSDEGTSFNPSPANNASQIFQSFYSWRQYDLSPPTIWKLLELYPNDPCNEPPYYITNCTIFPDRDLQFRRAAAIGGDLVMIAGRRKTAEFYTRAGLDVYSYRFDTRLYNQSAELGVPHFDNTYFSFQNITGWLGPSPKYDADMRLANAVGKAYVRFVYNLDPNPMTNSPDELLPHWPKYDIHHPTNMVPNATWPHVEADTFRKEGIDFINTQYVSRELLA